MRALTLLCFAILLSFSQVYAQFGQNKVQYKEYDWYYIQTKHFDIYFGEDAKVIAEFTAKAAEDAIENIHTDLSYQINKRISLIVYNSHNDFQETNTTDGYLSQGIGGFTEPFKNRVVFPFEGSFRKFRHVIHHELVHAVLQDMLYGGSVQNIISKGISLQLPLWYHEGMAEFLSSGWETNSDQFIRDAIINEYLPDINRLGGYFAYRGGQSLFHFIAETYGREKVGEILNKIKGVGNTEEGFKAAIGLTLEELNERWKKSLKVEYWPDIATREEPDEFAKRLTNNKKVGGFYNTSPAISPYGDKIAFISDRDLFLSVYVMDANNGEVIDKVLTSGRATDFEELNLLHPSLTWAPDNKRIALAGKSEGYDVINIIDVEEGDSEELPINFLGIESVNWSKDGNKIAFVGSNASQSDIYVYNFSTEELTNVTNDIFSDVDPFWSFDDSKIFFASDRKEFLDDKEFLETTSMQDHNYEQLDLYVIDVNTKLIERLTDWEHSDEKSPVVSPDGKELLFVSDYNGIDNIYKKSLVVEDGESLLDNSPYPVTNSLNGLNQLSISEDAKKLVFSSLYKSGYNIYQINNPFDLESRIDDVEFTPYVTQLLSPVEQTATIQKEENESSQNHEAIKVNDYEKITVINKTVENTEESDSTESNDDPIIFTGQYEVADEADSNHIDYSNFVFGGDQNVRDTTKLKQIRAETFKETLDDEGNYLVNKYKINFSPDIIYANAGYSSFYGVLGTTQLAFSDVLGNHRLIALTSLQIDLKNSDYGIAYYYLPKRIDYGVEFFHTARFIRRGNFLSSNIYRYRNYGISFSASLPFSRFSRISAGLSVLHVTSENLDNLSVPSEQNTYVIPSIRYVYDNVIYGYTSPIEGSRYSLGLLGLPGISGKENSFYSLTWDYRKYFRFWFDNSFVFRVSGGYSGGANPQRFALGGTESWINRSFAGGYVPIESTSDFVFLGNALPMRGYNYGERIGTKYSLLNLELRMPLIRYLVTGPLPLFFQNILGVAFIDAGAAWNKNRELQFFEKNNNNETVTRDLLLGTGYGFRLAFIFLWRFDIAWSYDMQKFSKPKFYVSLGLDF